MLDHEFKVLAKYLIQHVQEALGDAHSFIAADRDEAVPAQLTGPTRERQRDMQGLLKVSTQAAVLESEHAAALCPPGSCA